jgi:hypothetical protein
MGQSEPPSTRLFRVGKDSRGNWVVQDEQGLRGGLFVDRAQAMKFVRFENGNHPEAVIVVPDTIELEMAANLQESRPLLPGASALRRVA